MPRIPRIERGLVVVMPWPITAAPFAFHAEATGIGVHRDGGRFAHVGTDCVQIGQPAERAVF